MTRITVLGGSGYIGHHLVSHLEALGVEIWAPTRGSEEIFRRDLGHVIYAIGLTADFRSKPFDTVEAHVSYLARVLKHASFRSLLYLSSTRVYSRCQIAAEDSPIVVQPGDASDLYNLSKLMGESVALNCGREGVRIARVSNVVGGLEPSDSFLTSLVNEARAGEICLQTAASSRKDYLHIDDAVRMLYLLATRGECSIYNVASGVQLTHGEWAQALRKKFGCTVSATNLALDVSFPEIQITRFVEEFSFHPGPAIRAISDIA